MDPAWAFYFVWDPSGVTLTPPALSQVVFVLWTDNKVIVSRLSDRDICHTPLPCCDSIIWDNLWKDWPPPWATTEEMHRSQLKTTNQSQKEGLNVVNATHCSNGRKTICQWPCWKTHIFFIVWSEVKSDQVYLFRVS